MLHLTWILLLSAVVVLLPARGALAATFDSDLEGWNATGIEFDISLLGITVSLTDNTGDMVWSDTDGNGPGFAKLTDAIPSPSSWAEAPSTFYNSGDLTPFLGGTLSFEHKLIDIGLNVPASQPPYGPYSAVFISGNPSNWNAVVWTAPGPSSTTDWVPFSIGLNSTELTLFENTPASVFDPALPAITPAFFGLTGTMTFEEIMGNVTTLLLPFELVNNSGTQNSEMGGIDNVLLTAAAPEPATWSLLAFSIGALLLHRSRVSP